MLLAIGCLPGCDCGSVEVDRDRVATGETGCEDVIAEIDYGLGHGGGDRDRGGFVLALHCEAVCGVEDGICEGSGNDEDSLTREARKVVLRAGSIWKRQGVFCELRVAQWL